MTDLKAANVFSVLWGGGSTTSVVGLASNLDDNGWVFSRLKALGLDNEGRAQTRSAEPEKESTSSKKSRRKKR
jgi:hypothetical protein